MSSLELAIFLTFGVGAVAGLACVSYVLIAVLQENDDE